MKLHVLYNTLCTIELVMHITNELDEKYRAPPAEPGAHGPPLGRRARGSASHCPGEACILKSWQSRVVGVRESLEREGGRGLRQLRPQMTFSHCRYFYFFLHSSCLMLDV